MILLGLPGACSAVPHSPVSGNVSSTRGLPLAGPGIGSTPVLEGDVPQDLVHTLRLPVSRGSHCDQSIQHPADRAVVHPGSPYPPPCRGVLGIEAAFRPLSQRVAPVAVMLAAASSQEESHRLKRPLSPIRGGLLQPSRQPRDLNCGAGPCGQFTERWESR